MYTIVVNHELTRSWRIVFGSSITHRWVRVQWSISVEHYWGYKCTVPSPTASLLAPRGNSSCCHPSPWPRRRRLCSSRSWLSGTEIGRSFLDKVAVSPSGWELSCAVRMEANEKPASQCRIQFLLGSSDEYWLWRRQARRRTPFRFAKSMRIEKISLKKVSFFQWKFLTCIKLKEIWKRLQSTSHDV